MKETGMENGENGKEIKVLESMSQIKICTIDLFNGNATDIIQSTGGLFHPIGLRNRISFQFIHSTATYMYELNLVHDATENHANSSVVRMLHVGLFHRGKCNKTLYGKTPVAIQITNQMQQFSNLLS